LTTVLSFLAGLAPTAISFAVCLVACVRIFERVARRPGAPALPTARAAVLGAALGLGVWVQPFVALSFPVRLDPTALGAPASLVIAVGASIWAVVAFARRHGSLCLIGPGAILGLGVAASQGAMMLSLRGAGDFSFDDVAFLLGVGAVTNLSVGAFAVLKLWRTPAAAKLAALGVAAGLVACQVLTRTALGLAPVSLAAPGSMPLLRMTPLIGAAVLAAWLAFKPLDPRFSTGLRRATRVRAWRGSWRPAQAPRPAGTASLRRAPVRSVGAPAANLGRPAPPAH
jgi:NO-binding membrane sensor protein with MHYT domain